MSQSSPLANAAELRTRAASGIALGAVAVTCVVWGGWPFVILVGAVVICSAREWHRLIGAGRYLPEAAITTLGIVVVVLLGARDMFSGGLALAALAACASSVALIAAIRRAPVAWHALGTFYLGVPALAAVAIRDTDRGTLLLAGILIAVWAADTGAWFFGRLIGGPRLAPHLSPNKTWAGFLAGTALAGLVEAFYVAALGGEPGEGALAGLFLGLAGHAGDLFESWVKRCFRAKNMGALIPGHGGMLDRIDSMLFALPAGAALILGTGVHPLLNLGQ